MDRLKECSLKPGWLSVRKLRILLFSSCMLAIAVNGFALSKEADTCMACHSDNSIAPTVDISMMDYSKHGSLDCSLCHADAANLPHDAAKMKADCSTCHPTEVTEYSGSVHGKAIAAGDKEAASCVSCHGDGHSIIAAKDPSSPVYHVNLPATCGQCHSKGKLSSSSNANVNNAFDIYTDSIHGKGAMKSGLLVSANCSDCHGSHAIQPKSDPGSPINRANVTTTCGSCHVNVLKDWALSAHAEAFKKDPVKGPVCSDCHVAHSVNNVQSAKALNALMKACSDCHQGEFGTYRDTFHGEVTQLGDTSRVASCASCHGAHMVLPTVDPRSPTSYKNLLGTCQKCHAGATAAFTEYMPHAEPEDAKKNPILHYIWLFMTCLLLGVFGFFGLHTILWLIHSLRTGKHRRGRDAGKDAGTNQEHKENTENKEGTDAR